jgi:hypothetical protein
MVKLPKDEIIRGLRIEKECVSRDCNRDCANCDIVQERDWLLQVYEGAIEIIENSYCQEDIDDNTRWKEVWIK